jgi:hypothetical protein
MILGRMGAESSMGFLGNLIQGIFIGGIAGGGLETIDRMARQEAERDIQKEKQRPKIQVGDVVQREVEGRYVLPIPKRVAKVDGDLVYIADYIDAISIYEIVKVD